MTSVIISVDDGSFEVDGHTGYVNESTGNNDLCVAVSTMVRAIGLYIENRKLGVTFVSDGYVRFEIWIVTETMREMFMMAYEEFKRLEEEFPEYINTTLINSY